MCSRANPTSPCRDRGRSLSSSLKTRGPRSPSSRRTTTRRPSLAATLRGSRSTRRAGTASSRAGPRRGSRATRRRRGTRRRTRNSSVPRRTSGRRREPLRSRVRSENSRARPPFSFSNANLIRWGVLFAHEDERDVGCENETIVSGPRWISRSSVTGGGFLELFREHCGPTVTEK